MPQKYLKLQNPFMDTRGLDHYKNCPTVYLQELTKIQTRL